MRQLVSYIVEMVLELQRRDEHKSGGNVLKAKSMNIEAKLNAKYVVIRRA